MVALIRYPIADALVRVLPARAADRLAVRIARAAFERAADGLAPATAGDPGALAGSAA